MSSEATGAPLGHLLFVWTPAGYRLEEREGGPPALLDTVELGEAGRYQVQKIGTSPYPDDPRPCAFLIAAP